VFRFLRRHQPKPTPLAVLYWAGLALVSLVVLFALFYLVDAYLPGGGMF